MLRLPEIVVFQHDLLRDIASTETQLLVTNRIGDPEASFTALLLSKQVTHPPNSQIGARQLESVISGRKYTQPGLRFFTWGTQQNTG
jgi:hypothetical protein